MNCACRPIHGINAWFARGRDSATEASAANHCTEMNYQAHSTHKNTPCQVYGSTAAQPHTHHNLRVPISPVALGLVPQGILLPQGERVEVQASAAGVPLHLGIAMEKAIASAPQGAFGVHLLTSEPR